jgi:hypothetical protein
MKISLTPLCVGLTLLSTFIIAGPSSLAQPLQGGVGIDQEKFLESSGSYGYPSPQMMTPTTAPMPKAHPKKLKANAEMQQKHAQPLQGGTTNQAPLQANVQQSVALPPAFMGRWLVQGQRASVQAANPEFQANAEAGFAGGTRNIWNISGNPGQGYNMSNDQGVSTALNIYKVSGNTAFIRYQHPMGKTMAREAIVMQLDGNGASFSGMEQISIVKDNQTRATVKYQLAGQRQ